MKKIILLLLIIFCIAGCTTSNNVIDDDCSDQKGCDLPDTGEKTAALTFKESYELLNGKETKSGKVYRTITLDDTSSFVLFDLEEYVNTSYSDIDFTGILFISDPKCPWCRSVIETAVQVANEMNVENIYTIHAWDDEGNEVFRDKWIADAKGTDFTLQAGHPFYNLLINAKGNELLTDYTITKDDGTSFQTGEKRIYLPSFLYVEHNEIKAFTTGISELQEGGYDELTDEMKADTRKQLEEFFESIQR